MSWRTTAVLLGACSGPLGGPLAGVADTHCGEQVTLTSSSACRGSAGPMDAGMAMEEETVRFNTEADDDDCKYHVRYSTTPVARNGEVTFTVVVTNKSDGTPTTGAQTRVEAFLNDVHPAPSSGTTTRESPPGTYSIGPVRFDAAGQWTAKFHFFETCSDVLESSPHGHVGFFLEVP